MSETVKKMLTEDINLKDELNRKFVAIVLSLVALILIILILFFFGLNYYKRKEKVSQDREALINRMNDTLRYKQELFYRAKDTTQPFVMPMYDTNKK